MEQEKMFLTADLGLASLLYANGVAYHGLQNVEGTWKKYLVFTYPPEDLLRGWQAGSIEVNALAYWRASRTLKHSLKSEDGEKYEG